MHEIQLLFISCQAASTVEENLFGLPGSLLCRAQSLCVSLVGSEGKAQGVLQRRQPLVVSPELLCQSSVAALILHTNKLLQIRDDISLVSRSDMAGAPVLSIVTVMSTCAGSLVILLQ